MPSFINSGYPQKLLRINLTNFTVTTKFIPDEVIIEYLGGDGFLAYYIYKELEPKTSPFSEKNKIFIATWPLTGTLWHTSGKFVMGSKSPLTDLCGESNWVGFFAHELKFSGYDMVIIEWKVRYPVYIVIEDDKCEFLMQKVYCVKIQEKLH